MNIHFSRRPARQWARLAALGAALLITGCATPYGPRGLGGGYVDERLTESSYRVEFYGNGYASRELVWNYWIHRCAELTVQKGFGYFAMAPKTASWHDDSAVQAAALPPDVPVLPGDWRWVELKGGGAPVYVYVPGGGGTITTWSAKATVLMYRSADDPGARFALDARKVLELLKPMMQSQGRSGLLTSNELLSKALAHPELVPVPAPPWSGGANGRVDMDELKDLLPP